MKDPAFLFYYQDFLVGTDDMTNEEVGAYIRCLCHQAAKGYISEKHMKNICNSYEIQNEVKKKFIFNAVAETYHNDRLKDEIEKRKKYTESRANNRRSVNSKQNHMKNISETYVRHMENENENENINVILLKGGVGENEKRAVIFSILEYFDFNEMRNPDKLSAVSMFVNVIEKAGSLGYFKTQFEAYKKYKEQSKEIRHSFPMFLGTIENRYTDGGWNARNWTTEKPRQMNGNNSGIMKPDYELAKQFSI